MVGADTARTGPCQRNPQNPAAFRCGRTQSSARPVCDSGDSGCKSRRPPL